MAKSTDVNFPTLEEPPPPVTGQIFYLGTKAEEFMSEFETQFNSLMEKHTKAITEAIQSSLIRAQKDSLDAKDILLYSINDSMLKFDDKLNKLINVLDPTS